MTQPMSFSSKAFRIVMRGILVSTSLVFGLWLYLTLVLGLPKILELTNSAAPATSIHSSKSNKIFVDYKDHRGEQMIITLDQLWSLQNSYYQTIISFLVAINGILGVVAFFYIKSNSAEKAKEAAYTFSKDYINSREFDEIVRQRLNSGIKIIQDDYQSSLEKIDLAMGAINKNDERINKLISDNIELRRHISIISGRISKLDIEPDKTSNLELQQGGE